MQTTYYDTEDGALEKNRWMLRLRTENDRSVVTMKTPGTGHTRGEWECESAYLDEALPKLAALGAPDEIRALQADALLPVCGAKFTRITAELTLDGGTRCAVCGDVGELTGGGKKQLLCELELELTEGEVVLLEQLKVDSGLAVKAVDKGFRHQIAEVLVPRSVFAQQHQMVGVVINSMNPVGHAPSGNVDLAADDGLDPGGFGGFIKVNTAVHHAVVGDGNGRLPQFFDPIHDAVNAARAVK